MFFQEYFSQTKLFSKFLSRPFDFTVELLTHVNLTGKGLLNYGVFMMFLRSL
jgi:hypothetical protein